MPGTLYLVSTPIGNLEDLTFRAHRILQEVSVIAAEDTRHTQKLCRHYKIHTRLTSYHDFNKEEKTPVLLELLKEEKSIALVSDAGTPLISDPGYYLVTRAIAMDVPVVPIPGPSSVIAALSVAGLPTDAFIFIGFLPKKRRPGSGSFKAFRKMLKPLSCSKPPIVYGQRFSPFRKSSETAGSPSAVNSQKPTRKLFVAPLRKSFSAIHHECLKEK